MRLFNRFATFCFAVLLMSFLGCASTPKQEGTGEYLDDTVITTKVKAAVFGEPSLKSAEINVETFKGVVQLSGFVSSRADMNKAVEVARSVKGVEPVKNDMRVKGQPVNRLVASGSPDSCSGDCGAAYGRVGSRWRSSSMSWSLAGVGLGIHRPRLSLAIR